MIPSWKRQIDTHRRAGQRLKAIREGYGLSQKYVASVVGCHQTAISGLESGVAASMELLEAALWAFGLDLGDLKLDRGALVSLQRARRIREAKAKAKAARVPAQRRRAAAR